MLQIILSMSLAVAVSYFSYNAIIARGETIRIQAAVAPLLIDLERYRSARCNALPATATPEVIAGEGFITRDYAEGIFAWQFESGPNNTASLVVIEPGDGVRSAIDRLFPGSDHPGLVNSLIIGIGSGRQMSIPDLSTNVTNELGANAGCL